jgi:acetoin utilization protein AcuB
MFVSKKMTANPITIASKATVADASELMRNNKVRRLPVMDDGKLVGIVTDRDLREVSPSPATSLSIFELNYLLAKMKVADTMRRNVITIRENQTIEEAALAMYTNKIGGLVVMNDAGKVTGVITETDIFKSFVDVMGLAKGKKRITIQFVDHLGALNEISGVFKDLGININSLVSFAADQPNGITMVIRTDKVETDELVSKLEAIGYKVLHVVEITGV